MSTASNPYKMVSEPTGDRLQIGGEETDQMVMLRCVAPELPPRKLVGGEAAQKWVGHGGMACDFLSELPDKLARRHGWGVR